MCSGSVSNSCPGPSSGISGFWAAEQKEVLPPVSQHLSAQESLICTVHTVPKINTDIKMFKED